MVTAARGFYYPQGFTCVEKTGKEINVRSGYDGMQGVIILFQDIDWIDISILITKMTIYNDGVHHDEPPILLVCLIS